MFVQLSDLCSEKVGVVDESTDGALGLGVAEFMIGSNTSGAFLFWLVRL